ncbi:MAG: hypothetical protein U1D30_11360 [Planctomycetota bacterium]
MGDAGNDIIDTGKEATTPTAARTTDLILGGDGGEGADDTLVGNDGNGGNNQAFRQRFPRLAAPGEDLLIVSNYLPATANSAAAIHSGLVVFSSVC